MCIVVFSALSVVVIGGECGLKLGTEFELMHAGCIVIEGIRCIPFSVRFERGCIA